MTAWTDDEIDALTALWNAGLSSSECARKMPGRSRNAISGRLVRLSESDDARMKRPFGNFGRFSDEQLLDLMRRREHRGQSFDEIGEALDLPASSCRERYEAIVRDMRLAGW